VTDGFDKLQSGSKIVEAGAGGAPGAPARPPAGARMNPSRPFILRPIATSLLMAAILLIGIIAFRSCRSRRCRRWTIPTMQVVTFYPGASPDVVASAVTAPLERQLGEVPGLNQMLSTSSEGASVITLQFALSLSIDVAEQDVQEAINAAQSYLPAQLPTPPDLQQGQPGRRPDPDPGAHLGLDPPVPKVEDYTDTRLAEKISQLPGVGAVTISGGQKPAVRIQVNPTQLASYGLSLEDVRTALVAASLDAAKGSFDGPNQSYQIGANDQITTSDDYSKLVIAYRNGSPVMLKSVAKVVDGVENTQASAWMNKVPAVIVNIQRQPGRQHHRRRGPHQGAPAQAEGDDPARDQHHGPHRPHHDRPRLGLRRRVRALPLHRARRGRHLRLPADLRGHDHPEHRGAAFAHRDLRGDVRARLQPEQPDADGAHDLDRVRRRRRDRHDREHQPLRGAGRGAAGRRSRAPSRSASPSCR
jgi:hypothetical protein